MASPNVRVCAGTKVTLRLDAEDMDTRHLCIDSETEPKGFQDTTLRINWTVKKDGTDYAGQAGMNPNAPFKFIPREPGYYDIQAIADDNPENPDRNDDPVTRETRVTLPKVDLEIYDGQGGPLVPEADEETKGAFTVANLNDTDDDGTDDQNDNSVSGELDLMKLVLKKPDPDAGAQVTLTVPANVKLWKSSDKSGGEETSTTFNVGDLPKTLWAEARQGSTALRDVVLELEYYGCKDTVKATAIWCDTPNVRTAQDADYTANNSIRPSQWWPELPDKLGLQKTGIEDGDRFVGNMECVFAVRPHVQIPGMQWRCRQYAKKNYWKNGDVQPGYPVMDWVQDIAGTWSDLEQDPDIYHSDTPGFEVSSPNTSYSQKGNFKIYLEVKVHADGSWSRCSPVSYWKFGRRVYYYGPNEWREYPDGANFIGTGQISGEPDTWPEN